MNEDLKAQIDKLKSSEKQNDKSKLREKQLEELLRRMELQSQALHRKLKDQY